MISYSSTYRSSQSEVMDDFDLQGKEMEELLSDLRRVNKWLGGAKTTLEGMRHFHRTNNFSDPFTILDVGCGDGEMLRNCQRWATRYGMALKLVGIDANPNILKEARKRSAGLDNASFHKIDVFNEHADLPEFDLALCTLFLHHFKDEQIVDLVQRLTSKAKVGVIINDLHRSRWAFGLFRIFSQVALRTKISRHDGLVSIARGFKKKELNHLSELITGKHRIKWKWAFRYQWLIQK